MGFHCRVPPCSLSRLLSCFACSVPYLSDIWGLSTSILLQIKHNCKRISHPFNLISQGWFRRQTIQMIFSSSISGLRSFPFQHLHRTITKSSIQPLHERTSIFPQFLFGSHLIPLPVIPEFLDVSNFSSRMWCHVNTRQSYHVLYLGNESGVSPKVDPRN